MNSDNILSQEKANLLRLKEYLVDRISKLGLQLEAISETQENLAIVKDYLGKTAAPFIALSYLGTIEQ
jgi:hypothetical protein